MKISIIMVNWNSARFLEKCFQSIYTELIEGLCEVIVVDNASFDGAENICKNYPGIRYVQSDKNLGFSGANNIGVKYAKFDTLLFLNPDTIVHKGALRIMYNALQNKNNTGAIGCKLLNEDGSIQTSCLLPFPNLVNSLLNIEWLKIRTPSLKMWGFWPLFSDKQEIAEIQAISGACIMVQKNIFNEVGGFSEEYFMYSEDVDLCYKIFKSGKANLFVPEAVVTHIGGGSTSGKISKFSVITMEDARYLYFKKFAGMHVAILYRFFLFANAIARVSILFAVNIFNDKKSVLLKWVYILSWTLFGKKALKSKNQVKT